MNYSDIPAGRELDLLVSEKVMGSPRHKWVEGCGQVDMLGTYEGCEYCGRGRRPERGKPDREAEICVKLYSSNIEDAWLVVEEMMSASSGVWDRWMSSLNGGAALLRARATGDAPLLICRAALQAVGA